MRAYREYIRKVKNKFNISIDSNSISKINNRLLSYEAKDSKNNIYESMKCLDRVFLDIEINGNERNVENFIAVISAKYLLELGYTIETIKIILENDYVNSLEYV